MSTITANTSVTLNGSSSFKLGTDTYKWSDHGLFVVDAWVANDDPVRTVNYTLTSKNWGVSFMHFGGNTRAIINDQTTGTADGGDGIYIDFIAFSNTGPNTVTLRNAEVGVINGYQSNDTISIGYYANSVNLGRGDDSLALTGTGEVGTAILGRGNDTLKIGNGYIFSADMGRGNDTVTVGAGSFDYIHLGRDADTIKFGAGANSGIVYAGENISDDLAGAKDFDTADFSAFTKALIINMDARFASAVGMFIQMGGFEKVIGGDGNDSIEGSDSGDVIQGSAGIDGLTGGAGGDTFVFEKGDTGKTHATADTIFDFTSADSIDLSGWDANSTKTGTQRFDFIGTDAFSKAAGELRYSKTASDTWIEGDTNGDGKADFVIHLDDAVTMKIFNFDI